MLKAGCQTVVEKRNWNSSSAVPRIHQLVSVLAPWQEGSRWAQPLLRATAEQRTLTIINYTLNNNQVRTTEERFLGTTIHPRCLAPVTLQGLHRRTTGIPRRLVARVIQTSLKICAFRHGFSTIRPWSHRTSPNRAWECQHTLARRGVMLFSADRWCKGLTTVLEPHKVIYHFKHHKLDQKQLSPQELCRS